MLLDELDLMRKQRAQEVLADLLRRGIKKIGGVKISDMEKKDEIDYDTIMNFYQNLLKKEKDQFEIEKQKKVKDVEYLARAVREEEKVVIEKYCAEHGVEEMKMIQKAITERHQKELKQKQSLEKAFPVFLRFKEEIMTGRRRENQEKIKQFVVKKTEELKQKVIEEAHRELKKQENLRLVQQRQEELKKRDAAKAASLPTQSLEVDGDGDSVSGW